MVRPISEEEKILAAGYVLVDLEPLEIAEFELKLHNNPNLQIEVDALELAFNQMGVGLPQLTPPSELKARIMDSVGRSLVSENKNDAPKPEKAEVDQKLLNKITPWSKVWIGIAALIGGLLVFDNFKLRQELQLAQQSDRQELAGVLAHPKSRLLSLSNREEQVVGNVLFTPGNWQQVILSAQDLPPLPVDQVYRMWLELADGQVIFCGEFKTSDRGSIFIKLNAKQNPPPGIKAKGVFITIDSVNAPLEPTGQKVIKGSIDSPNES